MPASRITAAHFLTSLLIIAASQLVMGCAGPTQTFDVTVHNDSSMPVTIWLTKEGGPIEPALTKWLVGPDVARIFAYRKQKMQELFGAPDGGP